MMGIVEYREGELYAVHANKLAAQFHGLQVIPKYMKIADLPNVNDVKLQYYKSIVKVRT